MDRKHLIIIIIVAAVVVVGIVSYFAYGQYNMSQMDKYMLEGNKKSNETGPLFNEAANAWNNSDVPLAKTKVEETINKEKEVLYTGEQAYKYADGDYNEYIAICIQRDRKLIDVFQTYLVALDYYQKGDTSNTLYSVNQTYEKMRKLTNYIRTC